MLWVLVLVAGLRLPAVPPLMPAVPPIQAGDSAAHPDVPQTDGASTTPSPKPTAAAPNMDPWEKPNRDLYRIHNSIDRAIIRPAAIAYARALPGPVRTGLRNLFSNLGEPAIAVNDLLQARLLEAGAALERLVVNSTVGVLGVFDVAKRWGVAHRETDLGITLGRAGISPGPYLFVPLVGPSTVRDLVGKAANGLFDPLVWLHPAGTAEVESVRTVAEGLDERAQNDDGLKTLNRTSVDPYAALRSVYLQTRRAAISGVPLDNLPDFDSPAP